jgi:hypothetical protein
MPVASNRNRKGLTPSRRPTGPASGQPLEGFVDSFTATLRIRVTGESHC